MCLAFDQEPYRDDGRHCQQHPDLPSHFVVSATVLSDGRRQILANGPATGSCQLRCSGDTAAGTSLPAGPGNPHRGHCGGLLEQVPMQMRPKMARLSFLESTVGPAPREPHRPTPGLRRGRGDQLRPGRFQHLCRVRGVQMDGPCRANPSLSSHPAGRG